MPGRPRRNSPSRFGPAGPREDSGLACCAGDRCLQRRDDPVRLRSFAARWRRPGPGDGTEFDGPGAADRDAPTRSDQSDDEITDALYRHLHAGRVDKAGGLIQLLFLAGRSVAQIIDGSLRLALARLGEDRALFEGDDWGHRTVEGCMRILHELRGAVPVPEMSLSAVGATPPGDPYVLPSMAAATVLESLGFDVTNLGASTPARTLTASIREAHPALVWLSVTAAPEPATARDFVGDVLDACADVDATLIIGGQQAHRISLPEHPRLVRRASMAELAAFAGGLNGLGGSRGHDTRR